MATKDFVNRTIEEAAKAEAEGRLLGKIELTKYAWAEADGSLHIDVIKAMEAYNVPRSEANERRATLELIRAARELLPAAKIEYVNDRERPRH